MIEENEYEDERLAGDPVSCPELICQVSRLPDGGMPFEGSVPFGSLDIMDDERFTLEQAPLHFKLHVAAAKQDIIVTGTLEATVMAVCDRCAEEAPLHLVVDDVLHTYKNLLGQPVDLTEAIREDILLAFPQGFHCRENCKGLCPVCGHNLNEGPCSCEIREDDDEDREANPWAALSGLDLK